MPKTSKRFAAKTLHGSSCKPNTSSARTKDKIIMRNKLSRSNQKLCAKFKLSEKQKEESFWLSGRKAQALIALIEAKESGYPRNYQY